MALELVKSLFVLVTVALSIPALLHLIENHRIAEQEDRVIPRKTRAVFISVWAALVLLFSLPWMTVVSALPSLPIRAVLSDGAIGRALVVSLLSSTAGALGTTVFALATGYSLYTFYPLRTGNRRLIRRVSVLLVLTVFSTEGYSERSCCSRLPASSTRSRCSGRRFSSSTTCLSRPVSPPHVS